MAQLDRAALKAFFETGDKPTEAQFADLIDSLFALIDDNTFTKTIISNVPVLGTGAGGKVLKKGNLVIQMGEFGSNDLAITTDNGAFLAGGSLFIDNNVSGLLFKGAVFIEGTNIATKVLFESFTALIVKKPGSVIQTILAGDELNIGASILEKIGFFGNAAILQPSITGSRGGNAALASLLTELDNLGIINDTTTA